MNESKLVRNSLIDIAPNNSNKNAQTTKKEGEECDKKKLKPVVKKGNVVKKKRTIFDKFTESFLGESENLGDYILYDVLVPAFRDTVSDMGFGVIERLFGGGRFGGRGPSRILRDKGRSYVSYGGAPNNNRRGGLARDNVRPLDGGSRTRHNFQNVIFTNKWEAEEVLSHLAEMIIQYNEANVRQFYELSNIEAEYTDETYGWTSLRDAYVDRTREGYIIVFPPTRPL